MGDSLFDGMSTSGSTPVRVLCENLPQFRQEVFATVQTRGYNKKVVVEKKNLWKFREAKILVRLI